MMLSGEEGLVCEVCVGRMQLQNVSEFKYLGCVLVELGIGETQCHREVVSGRIVVQDSWY